MRWPVVWGAAAAGLAFLALFFSDGSSQSRLFWIGVPALLVHAEWFGLVREEQLEEYAHALGDRPEPDHAVSASGQEDVAVR